VSFQRPVNSEKRKAARRAGTAGCLFWFVFGQAKMNNIKLKMLSHAAEQQRNERKKYN
jgi:hypothetical protein